MATKKVSRNPIRVGNAVFVRAVTHYATGRIVEITKDEIVLEDAAWIADSGRFSQALEKGESVLNEIEPFHSPVAIGRGAIVDVTSWPHALPRKVK